MTNHRNLVIFGAGGHAKAVFDIATTLNEFRVVAFVDEFQDTDRQLFGIPVLGTINDVEPCSFVIAIGNNRARKRLYDDLQRSGSHLERLVHPSAIISSLATVGLGTVVGPLAVINAGANIGENCIINTGAIIEHDCIIESHCHIASGACLAGNIRVGEGTLIGTAACARPKARIGEWSTIGAGAVVTENIRDHCTAVGIPAKPLVGKVSNP